MKTDPLRVQSALRLQRLGREGTKPWDDVGHGAYVKNAKVSV